MSAQVLPEHICYVHCNFCNTVLAVSIMLNSPLLSPLSHLIVIRLLTWFLFLQNQLQRRDSARLLHITGLSMFSSMFREEIQRIKANNPDISHREAFSTAAKNWAHFPRIHFGLNIDDNKQAKLDEPVSVPVNKPGGQKGHSFC
ncbi:hypothetical protein BHE74_00025077 [Ensete ventricosum]|nr:hypothetical protein GW17_00046311 [Ensete ventricosum]RWW67496.1 hypothetical protein BHE74_00025077 [Ensete ventricosum]